MNWAAVVFILCTPFGWIGILCVGAAIAMIIEALKR